MNLDSQDAWIFILSTIRYSMGRRSYIVGLSQELFHKYKSLLTPQNIEQIYDEVERELNRHDNFGTTLGDQMDHDSWMRFVETRDIEVELKECTCKGGNDCLCEGREFSKGKWAMKLQYLVLGIIGVGVVLLSIALISSLRQQQQSSHYIITISKE